MTKVGSLITSILELHADVRLAKSNDLHFLRLNCEVIARRKRGLSTKSHALVDAFGSPISFHLTPRPACDLDGTDITL
jgi:hypothetical protein